MKPTQTHPTCYEIRVAGHLPPQWADWFENLTITLEEDGDTLMTGPVVDQAALHGLLKKVRDLGMPLVSVSPVEPGRTDQSDVKFIQVQFNKTHPYRSKKGDKNEYDQRKSP